MMLQNHSWKLAGGWGFPNTTTPLDLDAIPENPYCPKCETNFRNGELCTDCAEEKRPRGMHPGVYINNDIDLSSYSRVQELEKQLEEQKAKVGRWAEHAGKLSGEKQTRERENEKLKESVPSPRTEEVAETVHQLGEDVSSPGVVTWGKTHFYSSGYSTSKYIPGITR